MAAIGEMSTENYLTQGCVYWRESPMVKRPKCSSSGNAQEGILSGLCAEGGMAWHSTAQHDIEHEAQNTTRAQHGQRGPSLSMGHARSRLPLNLAEVKVSALITNHQGAEIQGFLPLHSFIGEAHECQRNPQPCSVLLSLRIWPLSVHL